MLSVYDKRRILVHDGKLPENVLAKLELEAWKLLDILLLSAIDEINQH